MKVYTLTHDQLFHLWHKAHSRGVDICLLNLGIDTRVEDDIFREYVAALTPEPSADVAESLHGAAQTYHGLPIWEPGDLVRTLAPIIEAEVERRVRERISRIEATELVCEIHRRSEKVGDDEDFDVSVGREWYDSFCACLEDSGKGTTKGTSDD